MNLLLYNKVSAIFLLSAMVYGGITEGWRASLMILFMMLATLYMAKTFHNREASRAAFAAGLAFQSALIAWHNVVILLPLFLFFFIKPMESLSGRNLLAVVLGLLTPLWLLLPIMFALCASVDNTISLMALEPYALYSEWLWFDYRDVATIHYIAYAIELLLFLLLVMQRSQNVFKGKWIVRSQRSMYISLVWFLAVVILLLPSHAGFLLPLMLAFIGPIAAGLLSRDSNVRY